MVTPLLQASRTARAVPVTEISGGGDVILLAPHPDDETLGCGAAIAALADLGHRVQVIVITDGGHSHPNSQTHPRTELCRLRAMEVTKAVNILNNGKGPAPILLDYPDNAAPDGVNAATAAASRIQPHVTGSVTALWTTWACDPHPDHRRTARIAQCLADQNPQLALWSYPIWGRFDAQAMAFDPDGLVQFETHPWQQRKAAALAAHATQMSAMINDDPKGFQMDRQTQDHFIGTPEIFLRER
jgi:LmbE family N-acetylglucosaminyl deacetylase